MNLLIDPNFLAGLSILSLLVTLVAFYITYITYINPISRFYPLLKNKNNWTKVNGTLGLLDVYRHNRFSQYSIEIDYSEPVVDEFNEDWMDEFNFPDNSNNSSFYVRLNCSGSIYSSELFVSCDGGRYFLPIPRIRNHSGNREYYLEQSQIQLSRIVGKFYHEETADIFWSNSTMVNVKVPRTILHRLKLLIGVARLNE